MNLATLRVEGEDSALAQVTDALALEVDAQWKVGEKNPQGKPNAASGFNATVADAESRTDLETRVRALLERCRRKQISFKLSGLTAQLDIGLRVGTAQQFSAGVEFTPVDLQIFGEIGLELRVSAYPCSDETKDGAGNM